MKERFNKQELLAITREILADVAEWTGTIFDGEAAKRLARDIPESEHGYVAISSAGADIENSIVLRHMTRVIDFLNTSVWHGDPSNLWGTLNELTPFHLILQSKPGLVDEVAGQMIKSAHAKKISTALDAFTAYVLLVNEMPVDIRQLAAISGLAEKTVRMAAVGRDRNPDLVTVKDGTRTLIPSNEAIRWLKSKIEFKELDWSSEQFLPPDDPKDIGELGPYLQNLRKISGLSVEELASMLGWDSDTKCAYEELEQDAEIINFKLLPTAVVMQLAQVITPGDSVDLVKVIEKIIHPVRLDQEIQEKMLVSGGIYE